MFTKVKTFFTQMFSSITTKTVYRTWLNIWVTRRVSLKHGLLTIRIHLRMLFFFFWCPCYSSFLLWCCSLLCLYVLRSVLCGPLRFPQQTMLGSLKPPDVLYKSTCLIYVICVCMCTVVSNTYRVVFLLCFFVLCILCCQLLWIVPFFIVSSVFSDVYLMYIL